MKKQSYKDWVSRWLGENNRFGGALAKIIYSDFDFPHSSEKEKNFARLKELNATDEALMAFSGGWKLYVKDQNKKIRESSLESRLVHEVEKRGGLCWKFTSPGKVGVPDRIILAPAGLVAFVEMKAPGKKLRPIQEKRAKQITDLGILCFCLSSNTDIADFIQELFGG